MEAALDSGRTAPEAATIALALGSKEALAQYLKRAPDLLPVAQCSASSVKNQNSSPIASGPGAAIDGDLTTCWRRRHKRLLRRVE